EIGSAIQDQAASMSGDGDPDLVRYLESAAADEYFFVEENVDSPAQFVLQPGGHLPVQRNVALEDFQERSGEGPAVGPRATRAPKPRRYRPQKDQNQNQHQQDQEQ